jgi:hypothetical protein
MESPARPAAASVSGAFALPPDARCSFDQTRRRPEVRPLLRLDPPTTTRRLSSISTRPVGPDTEIAQDLQDKRLVRTFVNVYGQHPQQQPQQQEPCFPKEAVMAAVEECMRKQAEGLLHSLEGIGGRLSQLELYCYKLERSIGELRSDVMDYHSEGTVNFRCLDKNIRQVRTISSLPLQSLDPCALAHYIPCSRVPIMLKELFTFSF